MYIHVLPGSQSHHRTYEVTHIASHSYKAMRVKCLRTVINDTNNTMAQTEQDLNQQP